MLHFFADSAGAGTGTAETGTAQDFFLNMWETIKGFFSPENLADIAFKAAVAIVLIIVAHYLVKFINWLVFKTLSRDKKKRKERKGKKIRPAINYSVIYFLQSLIRVIIYLITVVIILAMFGADFTGLGTILAGAVAGISLSLQDVISSFAYGIIILSTHEYKIGDYIMVQGGPEGTIKKINLLTTVITTVPCETVYIPNNVIGKASVINTSVEPVRMNTIKFKIPTATDIDLIRKTLLRAADENSLALKDPKPYMFIDSIGDRDMTVALRIYVGNDDYWELGRQMNETVVKEMQKLGVKIGKGEIDVQIADMRALRAEAFENKVDKAE